MQFATIDLLTQYAWLIPFYGLLGAAITLPWSAGIIRRTGPRPAAYVNLFMTFLGVLHGSLVMSQIWQHPTQKLTLHWLTVADLDLSLTIELSPISLGALELIAGISFLAQLYALGYMEKDWSLARFFGLMGVFEAALSGIALSDSLLLSYGLLEILTFSTYLLVGFWYAQPLVVKAARDAFLTKRVGDIILLMGLVALSSYGAGLSFSQLEEWALTSPISTFTATLIGLSLIAGPTGKCAQFPLNLWLDEAMEGPNPAGILRNSVVVSAGAYVLIKLQPVFSLSPVSSVVLIVIGAVTAVGTSLIALAQIDIKRALCHSTSAYLGLAFIAVGLGQVDIAFLLVFSHAVAKALLFMVVGSIITTTSNQNITEMGGLWSRMPATTTAFLVGSGGIVAFLPTGMFWTMHRWFNGSWELHWWLLGVILTVNFLSAVNFTRIYRLVFLDKPQMKTRRTPEVPWAMAVPMVSLIVITSGAAIVPIKWSLWLSPNSPLIGSEDLLYKVAFPALLISGFLGLIVGTIIGLNRAWARPNQVTLRFFQDLLAYDFYIEKVYNFTVVWLVTTLSKMAAWFDRNIIDGLVNSIGLATLFSGNTLKYNTSGQSQFYLLTILLGVSLLLWWILQGQWSTLVTFWSSVFN